MDQLVSICDDFFLAGAETTSTTLTWAILFMTLNPEVQEKCAKEIETVLGSRVPNQSDRNKYVTRSRRKIQNLKCFSFFMRLI